MAVRKNKRSRAAEKAWEARRQDGWEPRRVRLARVGQIETMYEHALDKIARLQSALMVLHIRRPGVLLL